MGGRRKHRAFYPHAQFPRPGQFSIEGDRCFGISYTNHAGIRVRAYPQSHLAFAVANGSPQLQLTGEAGFYFLLQYSDDLVDWTTWTNVTAGASATDLTPRRFQLARERFFRAVSVQ